MDARGIYRSLCQRGKNRDWFHPRWNSEGERVPWTVHAHHVKPRCLGGKDFRGNIALLTTKEHLLVHHLLERYTGHHKLKYAYQRMVLLPSYPASYFQVKRVQAKTYRRRKKWLK